MNAEKKFLGATYKQSLIIGIAMAIVNCFTTAYSIYINFDYKNLHTLSSEQISNTTVWYIYFPTLILSLLFLDNYFVFKFRKHNYKFLMKFMFTITIFMFLELIFKPIFLFILYSYGG